MLYKIYGDNKWSLILIKLSDSETCSVHLIHVTCINLQIQDGCDFRNLQAVHYFEYSERQTSVYGARDTANV